MEGRAVTVTESLGSIVLRHAMYGVYAYIDP